MKRHMQLYRHEPERGQSGDCFRTVLACLLDLDSPREVPHFYAHGRYDTREGAVSDGWYLARKWLRVRGWQQVEIGLDLDPDQLLEYAAVNLGGLHHYIIGLGASGVGHTVICRNGKIVHDPSPGGSGIVDRLEGITWLGFLAKY